MFRVNSANGFSIARYVAILAGLAPSQSLYHGWRNQAMPTSDPGTDPDTPLHGLAMRLYTDTLRSWKYNSTWRAAASLPDGTGTLTL